MLKEFNKYDKLIILLIVILAFGGYGGALQPIRVIAIFFSPYVILMLSKKYINKQLQSILLFFAIWYVFSIFSLLWTSDLAEGLKQLLHYYSHISLFLLLFILSSKAVCPVKSILIGWCLFLAVTIPFALNEIVNDVHLGISMLGSDTDKNLGNMVFSKKFASVTFGNYNSYVTVLCLILPFLLTSFFVFKTKISQLFLWLFLGCLTVILFINASRGGLLVWIISIAFFSYFYYKYYSISKLKTIFIFISIVIVFVYYFDAIFLQLSYRFMAGSSLFEDTDRFDIYTAALSVLSETVGVGSGIGSIHASIAKVKLGVIAAHNLWLELLVQYGVVIFLLFIVFIVKTFKKLCTSSSVINRTLGVITMAILLPMSVINSGYLLMPVVWLFFASLYIISLNKVV